MPQLGEIKKGQDIGHNTMHKLIWHACQKCGKERWVQFVRGKPRWEYCLICAQTYNRYSPSGDSHYNWKGGITNSKDGYLVVTIQKSNPFFPMVRKRTANSIGRSNNAEVCLLATKGNAHSLVKDNSISQMIMTPKMAHSHKPIEVRERIVRLLGDLPRIELFARQRVEGWDCWGNEVESDIKLG